MLKSCASCNGNAAIKNGTTFADDNFIICTSMGIDDMHLLTYGRESLNERGIYTRRTENRSTNSSTIDSLKLCNYTVESMGDCIEACSACFLKTKMMFFIEKSTSLSVTESVTQPASPLKIAGKKLESPTSDQELGCLRQSLIRLPKHETLYPTDEFGKNECKSIEETIQEGRGKTAFSSDFTYGVKCRGDLSIMKDDEERKKESGPCLFDNCVDLGVWRRLVAFESQYGWDSLQSLRLGHGSNWNYNTGRSGLNSDKFSKYLVLDINVAKVLDSAKRRLLKLLSLQEDVVSSVDIALNVGLSSTCTVTDNGTVRLWDIEIGKCLNKMMVDDYAIVRSHIENSPGFLLSGIMIRKENASLFVWDPRDFFKPLNFSLGNMLTFHSVQFMDKQICVSDCFNDMLFDLRMLGASPVEVTSPAKPSSSVMKEGSSKPIEKTNCLEDLIFFRNDEEENEYDNEFFESADYGVVDSEKSSRSCLLEQFVGALRLVGVH